jgi:hypothetical protein
MRAHSRLRDVRKADLAGTGSEAFRPETPPSEPVEPNGWVLMTDTEQMGLSG